MLKQYTKYIIQTFCKDTQEWHDYREIDLCFEDFITARNWLKVVQRVDKFCRKFKIVKRNYTIEDTDVE